AERYARAGALLDDVGLGGRRMFLPAPLSGGQRQRVAGARAPADDPPRVLAGEAAGERHREGKAAGGGGVRRLAGGGREGGGGGPTVGVVTEDGEVAAVARRRIEIRDGVVREVAA